MRGGGGGGSPRDFFWGSEILAKSDLFGSIKDAGIFLGSRKKRQRDFLGLQKKDLRVFWGGMLRKVVIFLCGQILNL